jgi:hypothetical protein
VIASIARQSARGSTTHRLALVDGVESAMMARMLTVTEPTTRPGAMVALGAAAVVVATAAVAPSVTRYGPPCPFHSMTGFDCPGCGATRAVIALARGDVAAAFGHNAFIVASLPLLVVVWVCWLRASRFGAAWPSRLRSPVPVAVWAGVGIAFAAARNIPVSFLEPLRAAQQP